MDISLAGADDVADVVRITNAAYDRGEAGIWLPEWKRTEAEWTGSEVAAREVYVAREDGRMVGSIRVVRLREDTAEFGLLAVDPEHGGRGVGRALVDFAERVHDVDWMELELLVPKAPHANKQRLHEWYSRLGYREWRRRDFAVAYPEPGELLAAPADLVGYRKSLR
jgi:GNAT superfamily N-acetyltransferase